MFKKIISLGLTGVLLLHVDCFFTFAQYEGDFDITKEPAKVDYCKDFPKNQYGQTTDINCAFTKLKHEQLASGGSNLGKAELVGFNGNHEIRLWHKDQIINLAKEFNNLIITRTKNFAKNIFIGELINTTNRFFDLNATDSTDLAVRIGQKMVSGSVFLKNFDITPAEIEKWREEHSRLRHYVRDYWGKCNWKGIIRPICNNILDADERNFNEILRQEQMQKAREAEIKAEVYYSVLEQVLYYIYNNGYVGKDSLVAHLDFSEDDYKAQVYFTNIGLNQKIDKSDINPIINYNYRMEEL